MSGACKSPLCVSARSCEANCCLDSTVYLHNAVSISILPHKLVQHGPHLVHVGQMSVCNTAAAMADRSWSSRSTTQCTCLIERARADSLGPLQSLRQAFTASPLAARSQVFKMLHVATLTKVPTAHLLPSLAAKLPLKGTFVSAFEPSRRFGP